MAVLSFFALVGGPGAYAAATPSRPTSLPVAQGPTGPGYARHPLWLKVRGYTPRGKPFFTSSTPAGYNPSQIERYLGLSGNGSGQTIAIVDAYGDPSISSDLATFDSQFNLSAPPSFTVATPEGQPRTNTGWALEMSLDVEWAHAVAPEANILLVEAASSSKSNLMSAIQYAATQTQVSHVVVISNSWGMGEFSGENAYDSYCKLQNIVCTFSTGDSGNPGNYPAYNPAVVAVGGTTLKLSSSGAFQSETAWSGSGGGVSQYESKPAYQDAVNSYSGRGIPDVSYDANPNTGFAVYDSTKYQGQSGWFEVGGTSAGAPQWAAIIAVADQLRASSGAQPLGSNNLQVDSQLYGLQSGIRDVTQGSNGSCGSICDAGAGYDFVTGLGSPGAGIAKALAGSSAGTGPTTTYSASLSPSNQSASAAAGTQTTYSYTLTNSGSATDSFTLSASSQHSWPVSVSPAGVTSLAAGASATVHLTVTVPSGTAGGTSDTETLAVADSSSTAPLATATATTTAESTTNTATSSSLQPVQWSASGGGKKADNLHITLTLDDNLGNPVSGATLSVQLDLNSNSYGTVTGTTGSNGSVSFTANHAPTGTYTLTVTQVSSTPPWDGVQPAGETYTAT